MAPEIFCLHVTEEIHGLTEWCLTDRVGQVVQCGLWTGGRGLLETLVRIRVEMLQADPVAYGDGEHREEGSMSDEVNDMEEMVREMMERMHARDTGEVVRMVGEVAEAAMKEQVPPEKIYASFMVSFLKNGPESQNCARLGAAALTALVVQRMAGGQAS